MQLDDTRDQNDTFPFNRLINVWISLFLLIFWPQALFKRYFFAKCASVALKLVSIMFCVKSKLNMLRVFKNRPKFIHKFSSKKLGCKNVVNKISKEPKVPKATSKFKNKK